MVDKRNWREDKEVKTERAGTKRLDFKEDRFTNEVGKNICREDKIGRTRRVYSDFNSNNGS